MQDTADGRYRLWRRLVWSRLRGLKRGRLTVVDASQVFAQGGETTTFGSPAPEIADARIRVNDGRFYRHIVLGGSLGAAESYLRGHWDTDDLPAVIGLFAHNYQAASGLNSWTAWGTQQIAQFVYWLQRNTRSGSRKNISAHYDLGNDFYELFLDPTMTYSSAVFRSLNRWDETTLEQAQIEKYDRICRKLQFSASDHVLEIGCGWGGFAIHAAANYGCRLTATTISTEQFAYARQRIDESGLANRIELLKTDYRDLQGEFDKLVSIEMIEAVGYENFNTYFAKCASLVRPQGVMTIQAITIPDQRFETYRRSVDFIQRYVFPGGFLPSLGAIQKSIADVTDLRVVHNEDFAAHYAETLSRWSQRFEQNVDRIGRLACMTSRDKNRFIRLWRYYFAYCEAGFRARMIGLNQLTFAKPACRTDTHIPQLAVVASQ